jgi:hypothetical protein
MGQKANLQGQIDQHGKRQFRLKISALTHNLERTRTELEKPAPALNDRNLSSITSFRSQAFIGGRLEFSSDGIKLELPPPIARLDQALTMNIWTT